VSLTPEDLTTLLEGLYKTGAKPNLLEGTANGRKFRLCRMADGYECYFYDTQTSIRIVERP
jgi:hypothetical protein